MAMILSSYDDLASELLTISPILACATNMNAPFFVKHTEIHNCLLKLNKIKNSLLILVRDEFEHAGFPESMPAPSILQGLERFEAFIKERDCLLKSVEEYRMLYLVLVHARESYEENWVAKFDVTLH